MNGIININKPRGFTSHDVVAKLRRILSMKRIGHTGTLDPDATGVLPICVGTATRGAELLTSTEKEYRAQVILGAETDTQDASGKILRRAEVTVTEEDIRKTASSFVGEIDQIPPMFSAIKQDGKKLYELARKGETVERKPRRVTIHRLEIVEVSLETGCFTMDVTCSKGTYIRTLCQDLGEALGCFAHMGDLCRTRSGKFRYADTVTLEEVEAAVKEGDFSFLIPTDRMFDHLPALLLNPARSALVRNGVQIRMNGAPEGLRYRVYDAEKNFLTLSRVENGLLVIEKTFFQN